MDQFQYFPTPRPLAERMWAKFKDRDFARVLEPNAGEGLLADAGPDAKYRDHGYGRRIEIDTIEIDIAKHETLHKKGYKVVGLDFLNFQSAAQYTHVVMNPPFNNGVHHVLKAWDVVYDAEIVAIVNAETVRNPFSKERQKLVSLIEEFGEVEFVQNAFEVEEAERRTSVEVALIWLHKKADATTDIIGNLLDELRGDGETADSLSSDYRESQQVALPNSAIENSVLAFKAAVRSMVDSVKARARAQYYASLLGETMSVRNGDMEAKAMDTSVNFVRSTIATELDELKDRAWTGILRSSNITERLSSGAQRNIEAEFQKIKQLEFSVANIYGFMLGIVQKQGEIQMDMMLECFDAISMYHEDNTVFYKGWVSNSKHRSCGRRIKMTRFILPHHGTQSYQRSLSWDSMKLLGDFDKCFALLDGKMQPDIGLADIFNQQFSELRNGQRVSASYFDCRYHPGIGTIHFFPRRKDLIDRLNRLVGRQRKWLPPEEERVAEEFWLAYDQAEKFDKEVRTEISKTFSTRNFWDNPLNKLSTSDETDRREAEDKIAGAVTTVLLRHGIDVDRQLEGPQPVQQLLLAA